MFGQPIDLDALARSDREYEVETWLEEKGIADAWEVSPLLVGMGYGRPELSGLAEDFGNEALPTVTSLLSNSYATRNMLEEIRQGTGRIVEIVKALKSYSYLDQAPMQSIDVHEGLEDFREHLGGELTVLLLREPGRAQEVHKLDEGLVDACLDELKKRGELRRYLDCGRQSVGKE